MTLAQGDDPGAICWRPSGFPTITVEHGAFQRDALSRRLNEPPRAFARQHWAFPQANLNVVDLTMSRAGLHDQRHEVFLRFEILKRPGFSGDDLV